MPSLRRTLTLSMTEWHLLLRVVVALLRARLDLARRPVQALIRELRDDADGREGALNTAPEREVPSPTRCADPETLEWIRHVRWAIHAAGPRVPWRADCLVSCIAAHRLLRARSLATTFHIGVDTGPATLDAHAWLDCQGITVAGDTERERYTLLIRDGAALRSGTETATKPADPAQSQKSE